MITLIDLFLGIGSNEGNRKKNLTTAIKQIKEQFRIIYRESSVYETEAWGKIDQAAFLNMVLWLKVPEMDPFDILYKLKKIELGMGRVRVEKWGPRVIDLDILYYGSIVVDSARLTIPHPQLKNRRFVLAPLAEIAGEFQDPVTGVSVRQLKEACRDPLQVKLFGEYR